jgi:hypothetical protein
MESLCNKLDTFDGKNCQSNGFNTVVKYKMMIIYFQKIVDTILPAAFWQINGT